MSATVPTQNWITANHLLTSGLAVTSTSTPALNATYNVVGEWAGPALQAEASAIQMSGTAEAFADGTTSVTWPDRTGAAHTFTVAQFQSLLHAINLFVAQCYQYSTGVIATAPTGAATIP
jgi:hypothetical protein